MIILNGVVGLSLLGMVLHYEQEFHVKGAGAALAVLAALVTLSLVLTNVTAVAGPAFSPSQLVFAGMVSLVLYRPLWARVFRRPVGMDPAEAELCSAEQNKDLIFWGKLVAGVGFEPTTFRL